jgi:hypothetical protein
MARFPDTVQFAVPDPAHPPLCDDAIALSGDGKFTDGGCRRNS